MVMRGQLEINDVNYAQRKTRSNGNLKIEARKTAFGQNDVMYEGLQMYNSVPKELKLIDVAKG